MSDQNTRPISPEKALRLLDQAWAYYTPQVPKAEPVMQYNEYGVAA